MIKNHPQKKQHKNKGYKFEGDIPDDENKKYLLQNIFQSLSRILTGCEIKYRTRINGQVE